MLIILQNHSFEFHTKIACHSPFSVIIRERLLLSNNQAHLLYSVEPYFINQSINFSDLSQFLLLHKIITYIQSIPVKQNSSPFRFPQSSQIPCMMAAVTSLSATKIEKFPPPQKISPFFQSSFNRVRFTPA